MCEQLAGQCDRHAERLEPFAERYGEARPTSPSASTRELFGGTRSGPLGLLRDLHDLYLMACECDIAWTLVGQAAQGARDASCSPSCRRCEGETSIQIAWIRDAHEGSRAAGSGRGA